MPRCVVPDEQTAGSCLCASAADQSRTIRAGFAAGGAGRGDMPGRGAVTARVGACRGRGRAVPCWLCARTRESYHLMVAGTSGAPADSRRPEVHGRPARPHVRRRTRGRRQRRRTVLEPTTDGKVADEVTSKSATAHSQCSSRLVAFGVTSRSASAYRGSSRFRSW